MCPGITIWSEVIVRGPAYDPQIPAHPVGQQPDIAGAMLGDPITARSVEVKHVAVMSLYRPFVRWQYLFDRLFSEV